MNTEERLIWIDCEFTGLRFGQDVITEIAVVITDTDLNTLAEPLSIIINHPDKVLDKASVWVKENMPVLLQESRESNISNTEAEQMVMEYLKQHTEEGKAPLCGNTIGSDRSMIYHNMPAIYNWTHYRSIDVTSLKMLADFWKPEILDHIEKKENHRALDDILESIEELKVYREHFLQK